MIHSATGMCSNRCKKHMCNFLDNRTTSKKIFFYCNEIILDLKTKSLSMNKKTGEHSGNKEKDKKKKGTEKKSKMHYCEGIYKRRT
jgi:hypothetical protein